MKLYRLVFLSILVVGCTPDGAESATSREIFFETEGRTASIYEYGTAGEGPRPAVVVLHGSSGFERFEALYERHAIALVDNGYRVFAVMYYSDADHRVMTGSDEAARRNLYKERLPAWVATISDAIDLLKSESQIDPSRIAVLGFSQGAYIAVGIAGTDRRVSALVEKYGGFPSALEADIQELPPTLIIHGQADEVVPVSEAYNLAERLEQMGSEYEIVIYESAGHGFDGRNESKDAENSVRRIVEFLNHRLAVTTN